MHQLVQERIQCRLASAYSRIWVGVAEFQAARFGNDADNTITTKYTYDALWRTTLVQRAFGSHGSGGVSTESDTGTTYEDANLRVIVKQDQAATGMGAGDGDQLRSAGACEIEAATG